MIQEERAFEKYGIIKPIGRSREKPVFD